MFFSQISKTILTHYSKTIQASKSVDLYRVDAMLFYLVLVRLLVISLTWLHSLCLDNTNVVIQDLDYFHKQTRGSKAKLSLLQADKVLTEMAETAEKVFNTSLEEMIDELENTLKALEGFLHQIKEIKRRKTLQSASED